MQTEEQNLQDALKAQAQSDQPVPAENVEVQASSTPDEGSINPQAGANDDANAQSCAQEQDPQVQIAALRAQVEVLAKKSMDDRDRMMRAVAEADNARKRAEADVERERKFALEKFVKAIIPVYDSLDQALALSNREDPATKATLDGVANTITLLLKELNGMGVECINPVGEVFNPNLHQAISMVPSADVPPKHVLHVMQKGFVLNGRVVRPAMVVVSHTQPGTENTAASQSAASGINIQA